MRRDEVVLEAQTQQPTFAFEAPLHDAAFHGFDADRNLLQGQGRSAARALRNVP
jgi:hypothetical protein